MNYFSMKKRVIEITKRDDLASLIGSLINEARESISRRAIAVKSPFSFLLVSKSIPLVASTYSYKFDAAAATDRYGGQAINIITYDNTTTKTDIYGVSTRVFELFHSVQGVGDPTTFTIRGESFYVDKIPSTVTSKTFAVRYYCLPNTLSALNDEQYIDRKYYDMTIAEVCARVFGLFEKDTELFRYWNNKASEAFMDAIYQDSGIRLEKQAGGGAE